MWIDLTISLAIAVNITQEILAIVSNPMTPINILEEFVDYSINTDNENDDFYCFSTIFIAIARNKNASESLLLKLGSYDDYRIEIEIVQYLNAPVALLEKLANRQNRTINEIIAQNPRTPTTLVEKLATEDNSKIRNLLRTHPNISEKAIAIIDFIEGKSGITVELLAQLAEDSRVHIQTKIVQYPLTPANILQKFIQNNIDAKTNGFHGDIPSLVVEHPNVNTAVLETLAEYLSQKDRYFSIPEIGYYEDNACKIIADRRANLSIINTLARMKGLHLVQGKIAASPITLPSTLLELADYTSFSIHQWIILARNRNTPAEALAKIYAHMLTMKGHPNAVEGFESLISHPNMPVPLLVEIATNPSCDAYDRLFREIALKNPLMPPEILRQFANPKIDRKSIEGRNNITADIGFQLINILRGLSKDSQHPTSTDFITRFSQSRQESVRQADLNKDFSAVIAENENLPIDLILQFAASKKVELHRAVAKNRKAPVRVLELLANDKDQSTRYCVAQNPASPSDLLTRMAQNSEALPWMCRNPSLPSKVIELCFESQNHQLLAELAKNSGLDNATLLRLSEQKNSSINFQLIQRVDLPESAIKNIAEATFSDDLNEKKVDNIRHAIWQIVTHHNAPAQILEQLANNEPRSLYEKLTEKLFASIRIAVMKNLNTPITTRQKLYVQTFNLLDNENSDNLLW
jgi:hypothetical protein